MFLLLMNISAMFSQSCDILIKSRF